MFILFYSIMEIGRPQRNKHKPLLKESQLILSFPDWRSSSAPPHFLHLSAIRAALSLHLNLLDFCITVFKNSLEVLV